jgi:uncharacterized membrane protein YgcG
MSFSWRDACGVLLALAIGIGTVHSQERIVSFDSSVAVGADGSLEVTETIVVSAEGNRIRRGIYRDFPTRYLDGNGLRHSVGFTVQSLQRDGQPEPWFTEALSNGVRVNFGDDDFLPTPGEFSYVLSYRTERQLGFFDDHDELYWNATGNGWEFAIERATASISLPQPVATNDLRLDAYTGTTGSRADATEATVAAGTARWTTTAPLGPREGMTVVLGFPKGIVAPPSRVDELRWQLRDWSGPILSGTSVLLLIAFYVRLWRRIGRDPAKGIVIARYQPPAGHSPGGLRYLRRFGYDALCFSADAVALGVAGVLRIEQEKKTFGSKWSLTRLAPDSHDEALPIAALGTLAAALFKGGRKQVEFDASSASHLSNARTLHEAALASTYQPRFFKRNLGWSALGFGATVLVFLAALGLSGTNEAAVQIAMLGAALMALTTLVFVFLLRQPSKEGRALLDEIEGLRLYLSVAERDELASLDSPEPRIDAQRYQMLLPYALALDVEAAWTRRFTAAVGAAAAGEAARSAAWIGGSAFSNASFSDLGKSLGQSFSTQVASSTRPPGSSSGGGGRGSSGGGGGGGGGGGR